MDATNAPEILLCPGCFCALDPNQYYRVDICRPAQPRLQQNVPTNQASANEHRAPHVTARSVPPPAPQQIDGPAPPYEPPVHSQPPEPEQSHPPLEQDRPTPEQDHPTRGERRRSSISSSDSYDSAFTQYSIDDAFAAELTAVEVAYFSQQSHQASSPPPPPTSSPPTGSPLALSTTLTSSPSTESLSTPSTSDEPPSAMRRWVVFRGRVPGIYTSSAEATNQTAGFPHAFMLGFDSPATADAAYERFQGGGSIPDHGRGPWVVFIGRTPGVFTSYEELCASVVGFPNNRHRCCESVEEGRQALRAFLATRAGVISPTMQTIPGPSDIRRRSEPATTADNSWWCCFAGAEPGVYNGLDSLGQAAPAPGGVRRVRSEAEGWEMWTTYFARGDVCVVPRG